MSHVRAEVSPEGDLPRGFASPSHGPSFTCLQKAAPLLAGEGAMASSSALQRVLPQEVTHARPKYPVPLIWADDT